MQKSGDNQKHNFKFQMFVYKVTKYMFDGALRYQNFMVDFNLF